jgi:hypothetical protein
MCVQRSHQFRGIERLDLKTKSIMIGCPLRLFLRPQSSCFSGRREPDFIRGTSEIRGHLIQRAEEFPIIRFDSPKPDQSSSEDVLHHAAPSRIIDDAIVRADCNQSV